MTSTLSSPTTITEFPVLFDTMTTSSFTSTSVSTSASVLDSATSSWFGMGDLRLPSSALSLSPPPTTKIKSFSWSDFPVIIQEEEEEEELISNASDSISNSDDSESMNYSDDDNDGDDDGNDDDDDLFSGYTFHTNTTYAPATSMPVPTSAPTLALTPAPAPTPTPNRSTSTSRRRNRSTFYDADYIQSSSKNYVEDDYNGMEEEATKRARSAAQQYSPTSSAEGVPPHQYPTQRGRGGDGRVVRFAEYIEVRTYNVVLGDHPWCEDGYAIELGNEVLSIEYQHHPHQYQYQHHSSSLHRREYLERKSLLMEQMQVTHKELEEQQQQQYDDNDNDNQHHNNNNININVGGLSRIRSIDSCLSRVLNTIVNAAA